MTKHSNLVGGSTAGRLINCPGSFKATQALPPSADKSSEYAEEGTFGHAVMEHILQCRKFDGIDSTVTMLEYAETCIGKKFHDRVMTREHFETMIAPGIAVLEDLKAEYGGGFSVVAIELRVQFPNLPGAFGTCDLVLTNDDYAIVFDWKFGQGVPVKALYTYADITVNDKVVVEEELNAQLMFYLTGALRTKPAFFRRRAMVIAIGQPRTDEPLTYTTVTRKDVAMFREDLENAVITAIERDPPLKKGEHCRWAPCKINCPLWVGPIMGLAAAIGEKVLAPPTTNHPVKLTPYGQYLAKAKAFVDLLAPYTKAVNDQLHSYLEDGGVVPGWRLKDKAKNRQWIDENVVYKELRQLGFLPEEIWQKKLTTFTSADATAKKLSVKIPDELRVAPPSTETTVAPTGDPAPVVDRQLAREEFSTALRKLT